MKSLKQTQDRLQENNQKLTAMLTEMDQQQVSHVSVAIHITSTIAIILAWSRGKYTNTNNEDCRNGEHY